MPPFFAGMGKIGTYGGWSRGGGVAPLGGGGDIITSIFADGTDGFYFDFSKTDRLFQNALGTLADDPGENIYLGLEGSKWGGRTLAGQLDVATVLVAEDFASGVGGFSAGLGSVANVGGELQLTTTALNGYAYKDFATEAGAFYRATARVRKVTVGGSGGAHFRAAANTFAGMVGTVAVTSNAYATYEVYFQAPTATSRVYIQQNASGAIGDVFAMDDVRVVKVPGNHGLQSTTSAQPKYQTGGLARFDGTDDNLLTTLAPGTATSLLFDVNVPATLAATQVICGGTVGTSRCLLAIDTSGRVCAGVGTDSTTTILGSTDLRGTRAKVGLVFNGSTVTLYQAGASVYSAAQNGSPGSDALRLGASNNAGTAGSFWAGDDYKGLAIKKALTAAQVASITNFWGTS